MQKNRVFINEQGIVEISVCGDQTVASVEAMGTEALALCKERKGQGKPAFILDNLQEIGSVPPEARALVVELIRSDDYDKLAMCGAGSLIRFGANLLLQATGKGSRVKYFDDYDDASRWLLQP